MGEYLLDEIKLRQLVKVWTSGNTDSSILLKEKEVVCFTRKTLELVSAGLK